MMAALTSSTANTSSLPVFDDGDAGSVGDSEDFLAAVGDADAEVVHAAGPADADLAAGVDVVMAQPVVRGRGGGGSGFGQRR